MNINKVRKELKTLREKIDKILIEIKTIKLNNYITIVEFKDYKRFKEGEIIETERYRRMRIDHFFENGFAAYPIKKNGERYKLPGGSLKMFYTVKSPIPNLEKEIKIIEEEIEEKQLVLNQLNKQAYERQKKRLKVKANELLISEKEKNNGLVPRPSKRKLTLSYEPRSNWRTDNKKSIQNSAWAITRLAILARDDYTCVFCGWTSANNPGKLQINHVNGDSKNNAFDNLETVCYHCHFILHSGLSAGRWQIVEIYENANFPQEEIIFKTRNLREQGFDDEYIKEICGLANKVSWIQDYKYLSNKFGFVISQKLISQYDRRVF
jgi:5-methylcytosine-specific restriction endonuclease McrA